MRQANNVKSKMASMMTCIKGFSAVADLTLRDIWTHFGHDSVKVVCSPSIACTAELRFGCLQRHWDQTF